MRPHRFEVDVHDLYHGELCRGLSCVGSLPGLQELPGSRQGRAVGSVAAHQVVGDARVHSTGFVYTSIQPCTIDKEQSLQTDNSNREYGVQDTAFS